MDRAGITGPSVRAAVLADIYAPSIEALARQLPEIGTGIADALAALARCPSHTRLSQAAAQVAGAQAYLRRLQEALVREASGSTSHGGQ